MGFKVRAEITGVEAAIRKLSHLKKSVQRKILRKAFTAAGQQVLKIARTKVPAQTGLLRKSLGKKIKIYSRTGTAVAIVGPRTGFKREVMRGGRRVLSNPTRYAHLIELGTRKLAARPFLSSAVNNAAVSNLIVSILRQGIREEASR